MDREAFTILEFCQAHGFSRATYYNLPREDRPREMIIGGLKRISREAAILERWGQVRTHGGDRRSNRQFADLKSYADEAAGILGVKGRAFLSH